MLELEHARAQLAQSRRFAPQRIESSYWKHRKNMQYEHEYSANVHIRLLTLHTQLYCGGQKNHLMLMLLRKHGNSSFSLTVTMSSPGILSIRRV